MSEVGHWSHTDSPKEGHSIQFLTGVTPYVTREATPRLAVTRRGATMSYSDASIGVSRHDVCVWRHGVSASLQDLAANRRLRPSVPDTEHRRFAVKPRHGRDEVGVTSRCVSRHGHAVTHTVTRSEGKSE